ncbi:MAG: PP2C family protein-serine/threonine phosphatase [Planctomycetota bacterium]
MTTRSAGESGRGVTLTCMEVWGGSDAFENAVSVPGIDAWLCSIPHEGAAEGGDVHYISLCAAGQIARFVVADVAGHGADVAGFSSSLRTMVRKSINTPDQTRIARTLNGMMSDSDQMDGRFATAILSSYFAPTRTLSLVNAGHPRPIFYSAASGGWRVLDAETAERFEGPSNLPLGVIDRTPYAQFGVRLEAGDAVVLYTDSLTEAKRTDGSMLGEAGLLDVARALDHGDPGGMAKGLVAGVRAQAGDGAIDDDITVLVLLANGQQPPAPTLRERARAMGRLAGLPI